ncbi:MAG: bifunctional sulfate adenylyltransferase/adenylylsulfate kinase [Deltaproteobacteria bacterium]
MVSTIHGLPLPHGGVLCDLLASPDEALKLREKSVAYPSIDLDARQVSDLELLVSGGFSPLKGYMGRADYENVLEEMRLADGTLWPLPVVLAVSEKTAERLAPGTRAALRDPEGFMLAVLDVEEIWRPDRKLEARKLYSTDELTHPGVARILEDEGPVLVSGPVTGLSLPMHFDYRTLRLTPAELRAFFQRAGWSQVLAISTRKILHQGIRAFLTSFAEKHRLNILLHPVAGDTGPGDIDHFARVRCHEAFVRTLPKGLAHLNLLPYSMRLAGPREAIQLAIIHKNYGCTHMVVEPNHADPFTSMDRSPYYPRLAARELCERFEKECGVAMVPLPPFAYLEDRDEYLPEDLTGDAPFPRRLSYSELRKRLEQGHDIPPWYVHPDVLAELRRAYPARSRQGFTVFFTGLSGAGKSTLARILQTKFLEMGDRPVTLLDGDIVRRNLSSELGFSREHRHLNVLRIGFVASEITKNGGIAICAPIAPYEKSRRQNRENISRYGGYIEIYLSTPLSVCMARDRKGLYAKAKAGILKGVTGIEDPYEPPQNPDLVIDTSMTSPEEAAREILFYLKSRGYIQRL